MKQVSMGIAVLLTVANYAYGAIQVTGTALCGTDRFERECVLHEYEKKMLMYLNLDDGVLMVKVRMAQSFEHVIISVTAFTRNEEHGLELTGKQRAIQPLGKMAHFGRSGGTFDYELSVLAAKH